MEKAQPNHGDVPWLGVMAHGHGERLRLGVVTEAVVRSGAAARGDHSLGDGGEGVGRGGRGEKEGD